MKRSFKVSLFVFSILLVIFSFLCLRDILPSSYVEKTVSQGDSTYTVKSILNRKKYQTLRLGDKTTLKREISKLPYVSSVTVSYSDNTLSADVKLKDSGIVLFSEEKAYFYDGKKYEEFDVRDIGSLGEKYIKLKIGESLLSYYSRFGFSEDLGEYLNALSSIENPSSLIIDGQYDNNTSSGSGILSLRLKEGSAGFSVNTSLYANLIGESISLIENFEKEEELLHVPNFYELRNLDLVRLKR